MHNKAHCYGYYALLCRLGMVLYKICVQREHSARTACKTPPRKQEDQGDSLTPTKEVKVQTNQSQRKNNG